MTNPQQDPKTTTLVMWVMWSALMAGFPVIFFFIGGGFANEGEASPWGEIAFWIAMVFLAASTFVRWKLLPKVQDMQQLLVFFVMGAALAEGSGMVGFFGLGEEFGEAKNALFILGWLGIAQFAPLYAGKLLKKLQLAPQKG